MSNVVVEKSRFVVEYLAEGQDDVQSMFVEADSAYDAEQSVITRFGAFTTILSSGLTRSCGGTGATQTRTKVAAAEEDETGLIFDMLPVTKKLKEPTPPKLPTKPSKEPKVKKVTNSSRIRAKTAEVKAAGGTSAEVHAWAMATLGMTKSVATGYVKDIWAE